MRSSEEPGANGHRCPRRGAQGYADRFGIQRAYDSYAEPLADPDLDLIYNAIPPSLHAEWSIAALEAGKHVLREKPFTRNAAEAESEGFQGYLNECVAIAERAGKELIANETVCGARDDVTHVEVMRYTLAQLTQRGIGFTVHALHHSLVADLHRDEWGPVG